MNNKEILEKLKGIFNKVFQVEEISVNIKTNQKSLDNWDSLGHIKLIMYIEVVFGIKFNSDVIPKLTSTELIIKEIINVSNN
jgi:acyl carrier protein